MVRWFVMVVWLMIGAAPAQAIVIDSGSFGGSIIADFRPNFNMQGDGFSVTGIDVFGASPLPNQMLGNGSLNRPQDLSATAQIRSRLGSQITVVDNGTGVPDIVPGGVTYLGEIYNTGLLTGALTFDVEPFLLTVTPPPGVGSPFAQGESPFTMTGLLSFADQTVELEGAGTVRFTGRPIGPNLDPFSVTFVFAPVPEPATLTLLALGGGVLAVRRWWRR